MTNLPDNCIIDLTGCPDNLREEILSRARLEMTTLLNRFTSPKFEITDGQWNGWSNSGWFERISNQDLYANHERLYWYNVIDINS